MTPFGQRIRQMRADRGIPLKAMAEAINVSPAYLSALEHGHRGLPTWYLVQKIITFFNVIWDDAEELEQLAQLSHPRVVIDTAGMDPAATELANRLAKTIGTLEPEDLRSLLDALDARARQKNDA